MLPGLFILGIYFAIVSEILHLKNKRRRLKKVKIFLYEVAAIRIGIDPNS